MFKQGDILKLADNNEYVVVDQFQMSGVNYVYLVDINDNSNILYGKLEGDEVVELPDGSELDQVIKIVSENLHKA